MTPGIGLLLIVFAAAGLIGLFVGLERRLQRPGLAFRLAAGTPAVAATLGIAQGRRAVPILLLIQVPGFLYCARFRRTRVPGARSGAPET